MRIANILMSVLWLYFPTLPVRCSDGWHAPSSQDGLRDHPFCPLSVSHPSRAGYRYLSYLSWRSEVLHLLQSTWDEESRLVECSFTSDLTITKTYLTFCQGDSWNSTSKGWFSWNQSPDLLQYAWNLEKNPKLCTNPGQSWWATKGIRRNRRAAEEKAALDGPQAKKIKPTVQDQEKSVRSVAEEEGRRRTKRGLTFPGTLWCGAGSSAENFTDLGIFRETDLCCRKHDHCRHMITPLWYNYGVWNYRLHTVSHCKCDFRFKQCLLAQNDTIATIVGVTFFNVLQIPCFDLKYEKQCSIQQWTGSCKYKKVPLAELRSQGSYNYTHPFQDERDWRYVYNSTDLLKGVNGTTSSLLPAQTSKNPQPNKGQKKGPRNKHKTPTKSTKDEDKKPDSLSNLSISDKAAEGRHPNDDVVLAAKGVTSDPNIHPSVDRNEEILSNRVPEDIFPSLSNASERENLSSTIPQESQSPHPTLPMVSKSTNHTVVQESEHTYPTLPTTSESTMLSPVPDLENALPMLPVPFNRENQSHMQEMENAHHLPNTNGNWSHFRELEDTANSAFNRIKQQLKNQYVSKSCGCYRRLDECEHKIAPTDILFHLQNLDMKTLYHCNCTRRLARQLRKMKGTNEVEAVVSHYVSPLCFNLKHYVNCRSGDDCTNETMAVLSEARHLQRAIKYRRKPKRPLAPLKVKRHGAEGWEERTSEPVRLYDKCLQIVRASGPRE